MPSGKEPNAAKQLSWRLDVLTFVLRLTLLLAFLASLQTFGQLPPGVIDRLAARAIGNKVQVEVTLSAGYTCNGIVVTRSTDSLKFETIGLIGGVCGDSAAAVSYNFTDSFPPTNQRLYYQLLLGGRLATDTRQVVVYDFTRRPLWVVPNPATHWIEVRFDAAPGSTETFILRDWRGKALQQFQIEDGLAQIAVFQLMPGMYVLQSTKRPALMAKFIIAR